MKFIPVKTRVLRPPKDDIYDVLDKSLPRLREGDILFISSKILGIHQGRTVKIAEDTKQEKDRLIMKEAEKFVPRRMIPNQSSILTLKYNTLIPSAGIDISNGNGYYILWPRKPHELARELWYYLRKKFHIKNLAIVVIDSHSIPLRYGTIGVSIGFFGLEPVIDIRGQPDIFGRKLKITRVNMIDAISAMANFLMGEDKEQTPLLILRGTNFVKFTNRHTRNKLKVPTAIDMYAPLLKVFRKKPRKKRK